MGGILTAYFPMLVAFVLLYCVVKKYLHERKSVQIGYSHKSSKDYEDRIAELVEVEDLD